VAAFGQLYATWALAAVIGSILGGVLPGLLAAMLNIGAANGAAAYRGALLITTAITLLGWPLLRLPLAAEMETAAEARVEAPVGHGWALRTVRRTAAAVVVTMAIYSFAGGLVAPFLNVYFAQKLHLATSLIGVLFAVAALLSVPGSLLGTRLSRRWGTVQAVALLRMAIFPCLLALALGALVPMLAVAGFLARFALIFMAGSLDAHFTLAAFPATSRTFAAGLRTGTYNLGWALGAWSAGQLLDRTGYAALFVTSGVLTAIASLLFLGLFGLPMHMREQPTK
jgi:predicted MFS family arabinose efflux permease